LMLGCSRHQIQCVVIAAAGLAALQHEGVLHCWTSANRTNTTTAEEQTMHP